MKQLCFAVLALCCGEAGAVLPGAPPKPVEEPTLATMRFCQIFSVRAAWGAEARFRGAPSSFKYVPREVVHAYFMSDNAPPDGIYVADDLDLNERRTYEEVASFGWKKMDGWLILDPGRSEPDWAVMPAVFYQMCKDAANNSVSGVIPD